MVLHQWCYSSLPEKKKRSPWRHQSGLKQRLHQPPWWMVAFEILTHSYAPGRLKPRGGERRNTRNTKLKGSVERSLLPWAIFLIFTQNRPWKSEDHLCMLFFIEMSKERLEKSERTPPVSWRPWALAYSRDRPYNFSCLSALSKNGHFRSFFSDLACHLVSKSLSWPAMPVSNKKQEFEQWKRIKLFTDFWVRAYRFDFAPRRRPGARSM